MKKQFLFENIPQELGEDGEQTDVEKEIEDRDRQEPFDPEKISIDPKVISMDALIRRLLQGTIRLAPAFQRKVVWDIERKSQLIESLMLKIPIPMFYVAANEKGTWDVVDGLQRLTTIKDFILGNEYIKTSNEKFRGKGFKLKGLEFWGDKYDGFTFRQLPELLVNRILETEFRFTIINPGTPEEVKRNVFKRINTGGMPLTPQEIRHALYQGKATDLLEQLTKLGEFIRATGGSVNDSRMAARELILRFLAFSIRSHTIYPRNSDMDSFLSDTMRIINVMPNPSKKDLKTIFRQSNIPDISVNSIDTLIERFKNGMSRSYKVFDQHSFRKSYRPYKRSPINKTLFEVWGNLLADLDDDEFEDFYNNKKSFINEYKLLLEDSNFGILISRDSWKFNGVQQRYKLLNDLILKTCDD